MERRLSPSPTNDPAKLDTMATNNSGGRGRQAADVIATIVLLIAHGFLFLVTMLVLVLLVMGRDTCAYRQCGDAAWIDRAIWMAFCVGVALFITDVVVSVYRLTKHRFAFFVPMIGCVAQLALGIGAEAMESLAGPVS